MSIPTPEPPTAAKFGAAMAEVQRLITQLRSELIGLEVYARERSTSPQDPFDNEGHGAAQAYRDMADRINALRGDG